MLLRTTTVPHPTLRITVTPSLRKPGRWDVYVGGIHRTTRHTEKGALAYAERLAKANS